MELTLQSLTPVNTAPSPQPASPQHLLRISDLDDATWRRVLESAVLYRRAQAAARRHGRAGGLGSGGRRSGAGKALGMVFFNPSLRTRTSMERAAQQLGATATTLTPGSGTWDLAWADGAVMDGPEAEHVRDAIGVLSRYFDALGVRVFASGTDYEQDASDTLIRTVADAASVPVVNLESAWAHPCQAVADAALLHDRFDGDLQGKRLVLSWTYHPKALPMAVPNSVLRMAARCGMDVTVARPDTHALDASVMDAARQTAAASGGRVTETDDLDAAVDGADVVYAKSWGGPLVYSAPDREAALREQSRDWRITAARMARTRSGAFLHCLPVRRNVVVDDAVLDGSHACHLDQAEYRLHAQRALLETIWG